MITLNKPVKNIIITGTGGQGVIMLGKILSEVAYREGLEVLTLEQLGGMQRGGPVVVQMRIGSNVKWSHVAYGAADIVIGLEVLESLRIASKFLRDEGHCIYNDRIVRVFGPVKAQRYPTEQEITSLFNQITSKAISVNAQELSAKIGNSRLENMVMLGVTTRSDILGLKEATVRKVIEEIVPPGTAHDNITAFEEGLKYGDF